MIIQTTEPDQATGHAADMYAGDVDDVGFVLSHTRALAVNPDAHEAFEALLGAVIPSIGLRVYELATLGAARAIGSSHCLLAHGRKTLRANLMHEEQLERLGRDYTSAGLSEADVAVMAFAEKLSREPRNMTDEDSERLRAVGFSDRQIVDITLAAAARNLISRALLALAAPTDELPDLSPRLVAALLSPLNP
ncbi:carboxymuconolactone decarboxylase family protein [Microbacterium flavescens]|uniref:carboxymuconolactone decarboxylase family protein n=1 Tax=Microbacterium flavescens TaxID=69366 RepID=UPI001BDE2CB7|nr:carboxymuconolactone decarboxylase family protein [Microbacterium flavescens]BFF11980.1 hypothetical protein GCM10025699_32830 [Microbacterium flavescens]